MDAWNASVSDEQLEQLNLRAKGVILRLQACLTHTYQRKSVSEIARLLDVSRPTVIWMQHALQLRNGRGREGAGLGKWPRRPDEGA